MSADVYEALSYKGPSVSSPSFPGVIVRTAKMDIATAIGNTSGTTGANPLEADDVLRFLKLPAYAKILWGRIDSEALDSATSANIDLRITDGTTTKYLMVDNTIVRGGGFADTRDAACVGVQDMYDSGSAVGFVTDNDEYRVELFVEDAPAGAGAGSDVAVTIAYTMLLEPGELPARL